MTSSPEQVNIIREGLVQAMCPTCGSFIYLQFNWRTEGWCQIKDTHLHRICGCNRERCEILKIYKSERIQYC